MLKKIVIGIIVLGVAAYWIAAVTVLNKPEKGMVCDGVEIMINDSLQTGFLQENDILNLLKKEKIDPVGLKMEQIDLNKIESCLLKNKYIEQITCYKTPGGKVCLEVSQRCPILHVMSANGDNYYLDRHGKQMPKSSYAAHLVVVTGRVTPDFARKNLMILGRFIADDPFWRQQIQQINVLESGNVELIPLVGEHIIYLGSPTNIQNKLDRMEKFYTEGLNKAGWNKYSMVNLEYDNQIICKKK